MSHRTHSVIRLVIAEDQSPVRRRTALLLSMAPDMECVGQACNGDEAVKLALLLRPDVMLMDLFMPVKNGVAAIREITLTQHATRVLALTTLDDEDMVYEAMRAGAQAYLLKDASDEELLDMIRALRRGESRLTPRIARKVMNQFKGFAQTRDLRYAHEASTRGLLDTRELLEPSIGRDSPERETQVLTDQEESVLFLISAGSSDLQIALAMALAEDAVKGHVSRIMSKLHANTRVEHEMAHVRR